MAPISAPGPGQAFCPNCRFPLPEPRPDFCPRCGASLKQRPVWLTVIAALGAALLGFVALGMGAFGACIAIIGGASGASLGSDMAWIWGVLLGAVLCAAAAIAILVWLLKKPKP